MAKSLFLFDMTFWLYLAALGLYIAHMLAKRPAMQFVPAGHPGAGVEMGGSNRAGGHDRDGIWLDGQYAGVGDSRVRAYADFRHLCAMV